MFLNLRTNLFFCCCCITTQDPEGVSPKKNICDNVLIVSDDFRASKKKKHGNLGHLGTSQLYFGSQKKTAPPLFSNSPAQFLPSPAQKRPRNDLLWPVRPGTGRVASHRGGRPGRLWARDASAPSRPRRENRPKDWRGLEGQRRKNRQCFGENHRILEKLLNNNLMTRS